MKSAIQYPEHFVKRLEIVWGEGFLSPGGADIVIGEGDAGALPTVVPGQREARGRRAGTALLVGEDEQDVVGGSGRTDRRRDCGAQDDCAR